MDEAYSGEILPMEGAMSALIKVFRHELKAPLSANAMTAFPPLLASGCALMTRQYGYNSPSMIRTCCVLSD